MLPDLHPHWSYLDEVDTSSPIELYSRVRRIRFRYDRGTEPEENNRVALAMLQHASPVVLKCEVHPEVVERISEVAPDLKHLTIFLRDDRGELIDLVVSAQSLTTSRALRKLPLVALSVGLCTQSPLYDVPRLHDTAQRIAVALPTLEYISFDTLDSLGFPRICCWFRVTTRGVCLPQLNVLSEAEIGVLESQLLSLDRG
ncbi:hypothetical protein BKA93DRAFT_829758 [Sparassis latifolia]